MVPVIAANGASFHGAFSYYCHDKQGRTTERVEWTKTVNMLTDCAAKAWKVMAYTAKNQERLKEAAGQKATGQKLKKPVFAFSLSWAQEQRPDQQTMLDAAKRSLDALGLAEHQAIIVAHNDQAHRHVHIVANTVHPLTGLVAKLKHTKRKLSDFALQYEREGGEIYCARREENHAKRQRGEKTFHVEPDLAQSWQTTRNGRDFKAALEEKGYILAQGRKRVVIVDPHGKTHNPTRMLKTVRAADLRQRLADIDLTTLPDATEIVTAMERKRASEKPRDEEKRQDQRSPDDQKSSDPTTDAPAGEERETAPDPEKAQPDEQTTVPPDRGEDSAFEKLAADKIAALRDRHEHERQREMVRLRERFAATRKRLVAFHELPDRKQRLLSLREKVETAPWWKKLVGITRRDRESMREELCSYRTAVSAYQENLFHARSLARESMQELTRRQADEQARLEMDISRLRDRNDVFRGTPERDAFRSAGPVRERSPEGPSRGM